MMIKTLLVCMLLSAKLVYGQSDPGKGILTIGLPEGATQIFVNDSLVSCAAHCTLSLAPGIYRLRVPHPDRADTRWPDFTRTLEIRAGQSMEVEASFGRLSRLESTPPGCYVFVADRLIGQTPIDVDFTGVADIELRLEKDGFKSRTLFLDKAALETAVLSYQLTPLDPNRRIGENLFTGTIGKLDAFQRNRTGILIFGGAAVVAGSAAAYYKSRADHAFENAKLARRIGDQEAKRRYLNRAAKFDRYSAVGYVGMQINVVGVFYLLFQSD